MNEIREFGSMSIARSPVDAWTAKMMEVPEQDLSAADLEAYQLEEMRKLISYLKEKSHFYKETLAEVEPEQISSFADFRQLPTSSEQDLAEAEWRFQCVESSKVSRVVTVPTTGTSGKRKRVSFTYGDLGRTMAFAPYGFHTMCQDGDKVLVMMSGSSSGSIGDNIKRGIEPLGMQVQLHGQVSDLAEAVDTLLQFQPDVIVGIPFHMATLCRYMELHHIDFQVKSVLISADDVPEAICQHLRERWNCKTYRHYGMTELCMFGAVECEGQDGYHLRACDHLFEVLDPDPDGYGEIAITTFHHEAMPLLRYRTGDIGKMKTTPCKCGSCLPRIERIRGRRSNSISLAGQSLFLSDISECVFSAPQIVDFECGIGENRMELLVRVLKEDAVDLEQVEHKLRENPLFQKDYEIRITMEEMDRIPAERHTKKRLRRL